jgi:hypothetical protein
VDALRAGHLRERLEADLAQQLAGPPRRAANGGEVRPRRGVQVEHDPVRLAQTVGA